MICWLPEFGVRRKLSIGILVALIDLVRGINCNYRNLTKIHDLHPVHIERALKNSYSIDKKNRNL